MATKPYDQAFKFLAEQDPESLLILLGAIEPDEKATIELLPREISVAALMPDQPYRVRSPRGDRVFTSKPGLDGTTASPVEWSNTARFIGSNIACPWTAMSSCYRKKGCRGSRRGEASLKPAERG